jgi:hypothetical protein
MEDAHVFENPKNVSEIQSVFLGLLGASGDL